VWCSKANYQSAKGRGEETQIHSSSFALATMLQLLSSVYFNSFPQFAERRGEKRSGAAHQPNREGSVEMDSTQSLVAFLRLLLLHSSPSLLLPRLGGFQHKNIGGFRYCVKQSTPYDHKRTMSSESWSSSTGCSLSIITSSYSSLWHGSDIRTVILCEFPYVCCRAH